MPIRLAKADSTLIVALDFSNCSRGALRKAIELTRQTDTRLILLHVIDQRFVEECNRRNLSVSGDIDRVLFTDAKSRLKRLIEEEGADLDRTRILVRRGIPHLEITREANKVSAAMIVIGSRGMAGDSESIFFGGTAEKVLRFISIPVLCVPPMEKERKSEKG